MKMYNFVDNGNTAELNIFSEIGENFWGEGLSFKDFAEELKQYDDKDLIINLDSVGGSVMDGIGIANAIKQRKKKTTCNIFSLCASIATHIACACDEVNCFSNSIYMIHLASTGVFGNKNELKKQIDVLDKIDNILADAYVTRTGMAKEEILSAMEEETWLNAEEAQTYGFVDNILDEPMKAVAKADLSKYKNIYKNIPSQLLTEAENTSCETSEIDRINKEIELLKAEVDLLLN